MGSSSFPDGIGKVRAAGSVCVAAYFSPLLVEATTVLHGIRLAINSGSSPLLVESDALGVINVLKGGVIPCSDLELIVSDIFALCLSFNVACFFFIPTAANRVADALTKAAVSFGSDWFWFDCFPPFIELLV
ncbi:hypothetical protein ACOSP7_024876 [Xanthoceras sorbifolium]